MSAADEAVVRRFYEQMNNERKNELAPELFTADHVMHDPQVPCGPGPQGIADVVKVYQDGVDGHWQIEELFSTDDRVVARFSNLRTSWYASPQGTDPEAPRPGDKGGA